MSNLTLKKRDFPILIKKISTSELLRYKPRMCSALVVQLLDDCGLEQDELDVHFKEMKVHANIAGNEYNENIHKAIRFLCYLNLPVDKDYQEVEIVINQSSPFEKRIFDKYLKIVDP